MPEKKEIKTNISNQATHLALQQEGAPIRYKNILFSVVFT